MTVLRCGNEEPEPGIKQDMQRHVETHRERTTATEQFESNKRDK